MLSIETNITNNHSWNCNHDLIYQPNCAFCFHSDFAPINLYIPMQLLMLYDLLNESIQAFMNQ